MLTRQGPYDEEALVEAAMNYISTYASSEDTAVDIPYKEGRSNIVNYVQFVKAADQWVFVKVKAG